MTLPPDPTELLQQAKRELALGDADRARLQADLLRNLDALEAGAGPATTAGSSLALGKLSWIMALAIAVGGVWYARSAWTTAPTVTPASSPVQMRAASTAVGDASDAQAAGPAGGVASVSAQLNGTTAPPPPRVEPEAEEPVVSGRAQVPSPRAGTAGTSEVERPALAPAVARRAATRAATAPQRGRLSAQVSAEPSPGSASPPSPEDDLLRQQASASGGSTQAPPSSADLLAAELTLIRSASRALSAGRPEQALLTLARHAELYGSGSLAQERDGLTAIAQCAAGRVEAARANAARFLVRYPSSALATRARAAAKCELPR